MTFKEQLKKLAEKVDATRSQIATEEGTKNAFIMPFIQMLGFDVFDHNEVTPEFAADAGMRRSEKVDYALLKNGKPILLIECKKCTEKLDKHGTQLIRYFTFSAAKFGVLTNGIKFWFFTDLDKTNIMDTYPFFQFDITDFKESDADFIERFRKDLYHQNAILEAVTEMVYSREIRNLLHDELKNPSKDFIKYIADKTYLEKQRGRVTNSIMTQYSELTRKNLPTLLDELMAERLIPKSTQPPEEVEDDGSKITTTDEEIEAYFIVKAICRQKVAAERIAFRDAQSYFAILLDDNRLKTICRIYLNSSKKYLGLFGADKKEVKHEIKSVDDIFGYSEQLCIMVSGFDKK